MTRATKTAQPAPRGGPPRKEERPRHGSAKPASETPPRGHTTGFRGGRRPRHPLEASGEAKPSAGIAKQHSHYRPTAALRQYDYQAHTARINAAGRCRLERILSGEPKHPTAQRCYIVASRQPQGGPKKSVPDHASANASVTLPEQCGAQTTPHPAQPAVVGLLYNEDDADQRTLVAHPDSPVL